MSSSPSPSQASAIGAPQYRPERSVLAALPPFSRAERACERSRGNSATVVPVRDPPLRSFLASVGKTWVHWCGRRSGQADARLARRLVNSDQAVAAQPLHQPRDPRRVSGLYRPQQAAQVVQAQPSRRAPGRGRRPRSGPGSSASSARTAGSPSASWTSVSALAAGYGRHVRRESVLRTRSAARRADVASVSSARPVQWSASGHARVVRERGRCRSSRRGPSAPGSRRTPDRPARPPRRSAGGPDRPAGSSPISSANTRPSTRRTFVSTTPTWASPEKQATAFAVYAPSPSSSRSSSAVRREPPAQPLDRLPARWHAAAPPGGCSPGPPRPGSRRRGAPPRALPGSGTPPGTGSTSGSPGPPGSAGA